MKSLRKYLPWDIVIIHSCLGSTVIRKPPWEADLRESKALLGGMPPADGEDESDASCRYREASRTGRRQLDPPRVRTG